MYILGIAKKKLDINFGDWHSKEVEKR